MNHDRQTALNSTEIGIHNDTFPEWMELIPAGQVVGQDGRAWNNSTPRGSSMPLSSGHGPAG